MVTTNSDKYSNYRRREENSAEEIPQEMKITYNNAFRTYSGDLKVNLDLILQIHLYSLELVSFLQNSETTIFAYNYHIPIEINVKKSSEKFINKFTFMPDFTLKAEIECIEPKIIQYLMQYTKVVSLDKMVNLKLYKEGVWKYLDNGKSSEELLEELKNFRLNDIPLNVESTIKSWTKQYGSIQVINGTIFTVQEPSVLDALVKSK